MKFNGTKNIITDRDITLTGEKYLGETLSNVLENQQGDINELRSNLKWIYKYGGVGSGSGGGGGTGGGSSNWTVFASLGGKTFDQGDVLSLTPGLTEYTLYVQVKGGTGDFMLNWTCGGTDQFNIILSAANGWSYTKKFKLRANGSVSITVTDNISTINKEANYVVNPYSFTDIQLYRGNRHADGTIALGGVYSTTDIFFEDIEVGGLYAVCAYDINVAADVKYKWYNNVDSISHPLEPLESTKGELIYEIAPMGGELDKSKAGVYTIELSIDVKTATGDSEVIALKKDFNLIPQNVYIRLLPASEREQFYDEPVVGEDASFYKYKANKTVSFIAKTYFGQDRKGDCAYTLTYACLDDTSVYGSVTNNSKKEQEDAVLSFVPTAEGWYQIKINVVLWGSSNTVTKYIYCMTVKSSYNWFYHNNNYLYSSGAQISESKYFRINAINSNMPWTNQLIMTNSSSEHVENISFNKAGDFVINIGVQYNAINDASNPIVSFFDGRDLPSIILYQNKVTFQNVVNDKVEREIFIRKSNDYDPGTNYDDDTKLLKSHLVTISWTKVKIEGRVNTYQGYIYVDGILTGATTSLSTASCLFDKVIFHPGNYNINLFEITYLDSGKLYSFNDVDAVYYYNTFLENVSGEMLDESEFEMIGLMYDTQKSGYDVLGRTFNIENNLVAVDSGLYNDIANRSGIPTLVLETPNKVAGVNDGKTDTLDWLNTLYEESSKGQVEWEVPVTLYWSSGKSYVERIVPPDDISKFTIKIQGSSTRGRKAKNLTLKAHTDLEGFTPLFSPNYVKSDPKTFLPEQEFTLKADVVDSSHSNNTSVGSFVNTHNDFTYSIEQNSVDPEIKGHVRKCLEGFPVLVFLNIQNAADADQCYYLGIYNFNLGRGSHFNLGYSDLNELKDVSDATGNSFAFALASSTDVQPNIAVAEIQNNRKYWDFSQYHESILFPLNDEENSNFMFGDIVCNTADKGYVKKWIQDFVKSVAKAGGYIFNSIGKEFIPLNTDSGDDSTAYRTIGTVPSYIKQYKRNSGSIYVETDDCPVATPADLTMCVYGDPDNDKYEYLNLDSASYYYTTCMVFALVDSVQKNLNIKSWNGRTFGLFFYDMDTSLGVNNEGSDISHYCFSDFWKSNVETTYDEEGHPTHTNRGVVVLRDYVEEGTPGWYDTPSSYIFAIPKYISIIDKEHSTDNTPQNIYARWRSVGGILETADKFIDEVFAKTLMSAAPCLVNLNYRNKYLYSPNNDALKDAGIFKGTRIEKTREWLTGRLRILDGYFNLSGLVSPIYIENEAYVAGNSKEFIPSDYNEPIPTISDAVSNPDVYITKDIFIDGNGIVQLNGSFDFEVSSEDYSPLLILNGDETKRYLLEDSTKEYAFKFASNGLANMRFGGSKLWRTLSSINSFINNWSSSNAFYLNSDKLKVIEANSSSSFNNQWILKLPSVESLSLNGPNYKGSLKIDSTFYNLTDVNISSSSIALEINNAPSVNKVDLRRINSSKISIVDNKSIKDLLMSSATIGTLEIKPYWLKDFSLATDMLVSELVIFGTSDNPTGTLNISKNSALTRLTFKDFGNLKIADCPRLKSIVCNDPTGVLTSISVTNCPEVTSFDVAIDNVTSIDLSGCSALTSITLKADNIEQFEKLTKLNLKGTKVTSIEFKLNGNSDADSEQTFEYLDLTKFPNLSINTSGLFNIQNNSAVTKIKFLNRKDTPVILSHSFTGCASLERVYGHIGINTTHMFSSCGKFSIHGDITKEKWQGKSVLSGEKVMMPYEVLKKSYDVITDDDLFQTGDGLVTNITMKINSAQSVFSATACTIFDMYYFFSNCTNVTDCTSTFSSVNNTYGYSFFNWVNGKEYNNPNRYLFARTPNIHSLNFCFGYGPSSNAVKVYSPEVSNGNVVADNGLFSPLTNLQNASGVFYGYTVYMDRFVLRRKTGTYPINKMTYFNVKTLLDSVEGVVNIPDPASASVATLRTWGNMTDFFKSISSESLTTLDIFMSGLTVLNYDTMVGVIPNTVTTLRRAFVSDYGMGTINPQTMFKDKSKIVEILNSFVVRESTVGSLTTQATLYLNNNTFSGFKSLSILGFGGSGDYANTNMNASSFCGSGIKRVLNESGGFPYDIFTNTESTNLTRINCLFMNAELETEYKGIKLPGTLFVNLPKLENVSGLFYNIKMNYSLSEGRCFEQCTKLSDVSYLFAQDDAVEFPRLTGTMPKEFFYHGETPVKLNLKRYWADERVEEMQEDGTISVTYTGITDLGEDFNKSYRQVNSNISNMEYCFKHASLSPYLNTSGEYEVNADYYPGKYYSSDQVTWSRGTKDVNKYLYTEIWTFDGKNRCKTETCENLDPYDIDNVNQSVGCVNPKNVTEPLTPEAAYFAPPDLLRYCKSSCSIRGLFMNCGVIGWSSAHNGGNAIHSFGIKGRICPYMLKPVSDITNISNLFTGCKSLSYYVDDKNNAYTIPRDFFKYAPAINNLEYAFSEMLFPQNADVQIFDVLTGTLNVGYIFFKSYWGGTADRRTNLFNIFRQNDVSKTVKAFSPVDTWDTNSSQYVYEQYVTFSQVFKDRYKSSSYNNDANYSFTFSGYSADTVIHEDPKTLPDNTLTHNYTNFRG